ncbi:FtsK/SpoIIIE domain-containing protein [Gordonia malaquae]|uniref:FtsK/SpoIIIE domain-containing protein n=1 Tax=Gordonia malaquae TaxID=410332 RepID=UPI00301A23B6
MKPTLYKPPPSKPIELDGQPITVPNILARPEDEKPPIAGRIMKFLMPVLMLGMLAWMVTSGALAQNPMMMMMLVSMVMMMGMAAGGGVGSGVGKIASAVRNYLLELREARKLVHKQAKTLFQAQRTFFPQPAVLHSLVGHRQSGASRDRDGAGVPRMWAIRHNTESGVKVNDTESAAGVTYNPYMSARLGLGTTLLDPRVEVSEQQIQENLEPVTYSAYRAFMRLQRFVTDMPIGFDLKRAAFYQVDGDYEPSLALVRAMVANLAFNHSPLELTLILVTDEPDSSRWSGFKWLPHTQERKAQPTGDVRRQIYTSMEQFWTETAETRADRGMFNLGAANAALKTGAQAPSKVLVIVDLPDGDDAAVLPTGLDRRGVGEMTFLWVGRAPAQLAVTEEATLYLDEVQSVRSRAAAGDSTLMISTGIDRNIARADQMGEAEFGVFVRAMSGYRPVGWGATNDSVDTSAATPEKVQTLLEALGVTGLIEDWDPLIGWRKREHDRHTIALVGNELDDSGNKTSTVVELDLAEAAAGGTGPSGAAQGTTGAGKSYLLRGLVTTLAARYSPERLNFLLMDFKGGSTFIGYDRMAHVQAVVTNLESEKHLLVRMQKVVLGEIERRERLIMTEAKCDSLDEYRTLRAAKPELGLEAIPNLMIVADEFREFIQNNRSYLGMFESIAQVGRALGMHLLLVSQFIDDSIIGATKKNMTYGISLAVEDTSNSMAVIKSPAAADLKIHTGDAYLWRKVPDNDRVLFRSWDIKAKYSPPAKVSTTGGNTGSGRAGLSAMRLAMEVADGSAVAAFDSMNLVGEHAAPAIVSSSQAEAIPAVTAQPEVVSGFDERPTMEKVLVDRIAAEQSIPAPHRMWLPTLSRPLPFSEVMAHASDRSLQQQMTSMELTIGVLDDPSEHARMPYTLVLDGAGAHVRIAGDRGTGVTMTIEAMIAAAAVQVGPLGAQFYIIDAGNKLSEMRGFPNVGGYTTATRAADDSERIERYMGEALRVIETRQAIMQERGLSSFGAYWESKQSDPVANDPYGHFILVIDHADTFFREDDEVTQTRQRRSVEILSKGAALGVHVIVGAGTGTLSYKVDPQFSSIVHLKANDVSAGSIVYPSYELKNEIKEAMPADEAGRVLELSTGLHGRIMMPHSVAYGPDPTLTRNESNPKWSYKHDWRSAIEQLGAELSSATTERAPQIVTVDKDLNADMFAEAYEAARRADPRLRYMVPLGISAEDLSLVGMPDSAQDLAASANLILAGDRGTSGKTTALRWLLRWIMNTYQPGEAVVFMIDTGYQLLTERDHLMAKGMLGAYTADRNNVTPMLTEIQKKVEERMPTNPDTMTASELKNRSWWSGPELFIVGDPGASLMSSGGFGTGPADELTRLLSERNDLGVRLWMTLNAAELQNAVQSNRPTVSNLINGNASVLMLSGSVQGTVFGFTGSEQSAKFARRRPGLGQLYNPQWMHYPLLQVPDEKPWPELSKGNPPPGAV